MSIDKVPSLGMNSTSTTTKPSPTSHHDDDDDYIQCSLETVYTSTEMAISPPQRQDLSQQKDRENRHSIILDFARLKNQFETSRTTQHKSFVNYHQTILPILQNLHQSNDQFQQQIEQLRSEIQTNLQDNETLKMQLDINEQLKHEWMSKYSNLENDFNQFRRTSDIETSQIVKALQSDFEFELERIRSEHQEVVQHLRDEHSNKQALSTNAVEIQTDRQLTCDRHTSFSLQINDQLIQTESNETQDQSIQTSIDNNEEIMRRSINKDQQMQFNLAIQRALQNSTSGLKKQILQLEQQLNDKRSKIVKLKECVKKLQNFYTLSTTSPPPLPVSSQSSIKKTVADATNISSLMLTSSTDDEQLFKDQEHLNRSDQITTRTDFLKRSEPISMPSTFIVQSMLDAGNAATSPKTEQPSSTTVTNLLMDTCFKSSPNETSAAVELYTPFAASPPNPITLPTSPQTPVPISSLLNSPPAMSPVSRVSNNVPPPASPIAFFTVNRSDCVIIYYNSTYQHYMIYTYLSTLHFIHSDCYELFHIQQKQNPLLANNNDNIRPNLNGSGLVGSMTTDNVNFPTNNSNSILVNTSMINSTLMGTNGLIPSTTPLLAQVTDKEYCQAKKSNNRFNVPLGTKFYRVRVKTWKPSMSSTANNNS